MNTIERLMNKAHSAYSTANKYYSEDKYYRDSTALARLWESLAAYYQIEAYDPNGLADFEQYGDYEAIVKRIDSLVDSSLPRNISRRSMGGFGYHGETPIGETWGIVYEIAPNIAEIYQESNWDTFIAELESVDPDGESFTIERFGSWASPTENLMVKLISDDGKPTLTAIKVCELLEKLSDHPYLNDDDISMRESEADYADQIDSIRSVIRKHMIIEPIPENITGLVWEWLYENDHSVIERNARGYTDSGYIDDDMPIIAALYCMDYLDTSEYDSEELAELESDLIDYVMNSYDGIKSAFKSYKTKL